MTPLILLKLIWHNNISSEESTPQIDQLDISPSACNFKFNFLMVVRLAETNTSL